MVEPKELALVPLNEQETAKINALRKVMNSGKIFASLVFFIGGFVFQGPNVHNIQLGVFDLKDFLFGLLGTLMFWGGPFVFLHSRIPKDSRCIHAQYGIVNGKWPEPGHAGSRSSNRPYYLDVIFPETNTRYTKAICTEKDYKRVEQGQKVLTFVFDGRQCNRVYGVLLD